jgi:hypothetical protein
MPADERHDSPRVVMPVEALSCLGERKPELIERQVPAQFLVMGSRPYAGNAVLDRYFGRFGNEERGNHRSISPTLLRSIASNEAEKVNKILSLRSRSPLKAVGEIA